MRLNSWSKITLLMFALAMTLLALSFLRTRVEAQTSQPQTVTVTGQDDLVDEGDAGYTIITAPATGAAEYVGLDAADAVMIV